jgi:hypothetical protein
MSTLHFGSSRDVVLRLGQDFASNPCMSSISELAERQRAERVRAEVRHAQRNLSPVTVGIVTGIGDSPTISIVGGAGVTATNLGGVLRLGQVTLVQSDGAGNYFVRGDQSV